MVNLSLWPLPWLGACVSRTLCTHLTTHTDTLEDIRRAHYTLLLDQRQEEGETLAWPGMLWRIPRRLVPPCFPRPAHHPFRREQHSLLHTAWWPWRHGCLDTRSTALAAVKRFRWLLLQSKIGHQDDTLTHPPSPYTFHTGTPNEGGRLRWCLPACAKDDGRRARGGHRDPAGKPPPRKAIECSHVMDAVLLLVVLPALDREDVPVYSAFPTPCVWCPK